MPASPRQTKGKDERIVDYIKHHFFVRYLAFESWAHHNQLAEQWLREEVDQRRHGIIQEISAERFAREAPTLRLMRAHALLVKPNDRLKATRTPSHCKPRPTARQQWWSIDVAKVLLEPVAGSTSSWSGLGIPEDCRSRCRG